MLGFQSQRKLVAITDYASGGLPTTTAHGGGNPAPTSNDDKQNRPYRRLAGMIGLAVADQVVDAFAQTPDQASARMPDHIGDPLSAGAALYREILRGWDMYRLTPEFIAMRTHPTKHR